MLIPNIKFLFKQERKATSIHDRLETIEPTATSPEHDIKLFQVDSGP